MEVQETRRLFSDWLDSKDFRNIKGFSQGFDKDVKFMEWVLRRKDKRVPATLKQSYMLCVKNASGTKKKLIECITEVLTNVMKAQKWED